ncbi:MAG: hypothetical protein HOE92_06425, partial [Euryarchaeota archaeon]|nr:hypothetical protein [Euryarchaeota archaeon]
MRRSGYALFLTILMLFSGCLGMLSGDEDDVVDEPTESPLELSLNVPSGFTFDEPVGFTGLCNCPDVDASIVATIADNPVQGMVHFTNPSEFSVDFGILPSGTYNVQVVMTSEAGNTETANAILTISSPPEDPVTVSAFPPVVYAEAGEASVARVKINHAALDTCLGVWEDERGGLQTVTISGEYGSVQLDEIESSFNGTFTISCGSTEITTSNVSVYIFIFTEENPDTDGDGVPDEFDRCVESSIAFFSIPEINDMDGDGCHDNTEDTDDDADGRPDSTDHCSRGMLGWDSLDSTLDYDSDGCHDASEDDDDDNDNVLDIYDTCSLEFPRTLGWQTNGNEDHDGDGCRDSDQDDDDDNDAVLDIFDECEKGVINWMQNSESDYDG